MNAYLRSVVSDETAVPGASIAVQTYGDFLNLKTCFHGATVVYTSVTGFILQIIQVLAIWPVTLFGPVLSTDASLRTTGENGLCSG
jgi:hypothetical protein